MATVNNVIPVRKPDGTMAVGTSGTGSAVPSQLAQRNAQDTARIQGQTQAVTNTTKGIIADATTNAQNRIAESAAEAAKNIADAKRTGQSYVDQAREDRVERDAAANAKAEQNKAEYLAELNSLNAEAEKTKAERDAEALSKYNAGKAAAQGQYDSDLAAASARRAELINAAQNIYNQRNAEAQAEYDKRSAESQGKINSMYDAYLEAQNQQYKKALDQGVAAQEEARAGVAKGYQTAANDLSVQAERNRRNMNMQALANGLNTGTGSQMQLAANQAYLKNYGNLRGEEAAQNAAIDRAIANLKVDYENNIAQALADNNFQRASALMEDYKSQVAWLDNQRNRNMDYLDTQTMNAENRYDTLSDQARAYLNQQNQYLQGVYDNALAANLSRLDQSTDTNRARYDTKDMYNTQLLDTTLQENQNRVDTTLDKQRDIMNQQWLYFTEQAHNDKNNAYNTLDSITSDANRQAIAAAMQGNSDINTALANNQNWADTQNRIDVEQAREDKQYADKQALLKADTLASYGDFSGYAALYGQDTANLMKQMWINQNPQMAWQAGLIDDATYLRWLTGPQGDAGGGGGGGGYGGGPSSTPNTSKVNTSGATTGMSISPSENTIKGQDLLFDAKAANNAARSNGNTTKSASSGSAKVSGTSISNWISANKRGS